VCCSGPVKDLGPIYLGPIQSKPKCHIWQYYSQHTLPREGVLRANETGSNEPQRLFPCSHESLPGGYTSHDFVTVRRVCVITTALQPPSSIYRGLLAVPKVESIFSLNPLSLISSDLSVGVLAGTPPV